MGGAVSLSDVCTLNEDCTRGWHAWDDRRCRFDDLADERADILARFTAELAKATGDGSKKRRAGTKPPWYADDSHEAAVFSHLMKWKRGELVDPDSGAHPLVHAAWRCLAIALRESGNTP